MRNIKIKHNFSFYTFFLSCLFCKFLYADPIGSGGSIATDAENLKQAIGQWGTTIAGISVIVSGALAVSSLIIPWRFFKETLGRAAWLGLASAIFVYVVMSFFGNSLHQYIVTMVQCPLQIIGFPCN